MTNRKSKTAPVDVDDAHAPRVALRAIDDLVPYARNARTHSAEQVAQLAASIAEFGWTNPILADAQGIVAGHGRVLAARKLIDAGQRIRLPDGRELPDGKVPVIDCTGWSEAKRRAYVLADNQLALNAGWDFDVLAVELDELRDAQFDLGIVGFDDKALADLIGTPDEPKPPNVVTDEPRHLLLIECKDEPALEALFGEMQQRGLTCKVMS